MSAETLAKTGACPPVLGQGARMSESPETELSGHCKALNVLDSETIQCHLHSPLCLPQREEKWVLPLTESPGRE